MSNIVPSGGAAVLRQALARLRGESIGAILARGASTSFLLTVGATGLAFLLQVFLTRSLGAGSYGVYIYALTWINILVTVVKMGWDTALLRFVAAYSAQSRWGALRGILAAGNRFVLVTSLAGTAGVLLVVQLLGSRLEPSLAATFRCGSLMLPFLGLAGLRQSALQSLRRVAMAQVPDQVLRPLLLMAGVAVLVLAAPDAVSGPAVMAINLASAVAAFAVGAVGLRRSLPPPVPMAAPEDLAREWRGVAFPMFLIAGTHLIQSQVDTVMVGAMVGTTEAGIYAIASRLATLITFGLLAVNVIAAPIISQLYTAQRKDELQRMLILSSRGICAYSLPAGLVMIAGGRWILSLFGSSFSSGYAALVVLTLGQLVNALSGSVGFLMTMTGNQVQALRVVAASAVLDILLNAYLIPRWGIVGAATATSITTALWNLTLMYYVWKRLGLRTTPV